MKKIIKLFILLSVALLMSCSDGLLSQMNIVEALPETKKPEVKIFVRENAMVLGWTDDPGADEYLLYRDNNLNGSFNNIVYQGANTKFTDNTVEDDTFYYYRLAKKKGYKEFEKSDFSYGVTNCTRNDCYEPNNRKEDAKPIDNVTYANIYFYKDNAGNQLVDRDWYYVNIPARKYLKIIIYIHGSAGMGSGEIRYTREAGEVVDIFDTIDTINIKNNDYIAKTVYFQISVNKAMMNNEVIVYTIDSSELQDL